MAKTQHMLTGVLGLCVNEQGQFLVTQRNQPKDPEVHGKWQIPGGGMEFGETPEQTLSREMQEELNVSCRILYPYPIARVSVWDLQDKMLHVTLLTYIVSIDTQTPQIGDPETLRFQWIGTKELHTLSFLKQTKDVIEEAKMLIHRQNLLVK